MAARVTQPFQPLCRHGEASWEDTEMDGLQAQEAELDPLGRRMIVLRQRLQRRPQAGGKMLLEVPGYRFQATVTNLLRDVGALQLWRGYIGRAEIKNRIKALWDQFGLKRLACADFR